MQFEGIEGGTVMRVERALVGLMFLATTVATGCGRLAYNLPPASRLMSSSIASTILR